MERTGRSVDYRRFYETVLSTGSAVQAKSGAIMQILKLASHDPSHFSFLLNQIDWFSQSNKELIPLLNKIIRLYRGTSRSAYKVIYNLLADGFCIPDINISVVDVVAASLQNTQSRQACFTCLRENYPHKVCPLENHLSFQNALLELCKRAPANRIELMEIIFQNLAYFDTEIALGEDYVTQFVPQDQKILALEEQCSQFQLKYDSILANLFKFFNTYTQEERTPLLKEVFLIFQKTIMMINTKMTQITIFYLAEFSTQLSSSFLTLLMAMILENYCQKNASKRRFSSAIYYLTSYICRSTKITQKKVKKIVNLLLNALSEKIAMIPTIPFEKVKVKEFREENYESLLILQCIMVILAEFPSIKKSIGIELNSFVQVCSQKLHFQIYLNAQVLSSHQISHKKHPKQLAIKHINKFMPVFLPQTKKYVQTKMKYTGKRVRKEELQQKAGLPTKRTCHSFSGNQTPVTIGGNQVETKLQG